MAVAEEMIGGESGIRYVKLTELDGEATTITVSKDPIREYPIGADWLTRRVAYETLREAIEMLEDEGAIGESLKALLLNNLSVLKP